jgi:hypothetical protein
LSPFLVIGDFNEIANSSEKVGGNPKSFQSMQNFNSFINQNHLLDLGYTGSPYTWMNKQGDSLIQERLDRALSSTSWVSIKPNHLIIHHWMTGSDHALIILNTDTNISQTASKTKRFSYNKNWSSYQACHNAITEAWAIPHQGTKCFKLYKKIEQTRLAILSWLKTNKPNAAKRIEEITIKLNFQYQQNQYDSQLINNLESLLQKYYKEESDYWRLKSRATWLEKADLNTKYFHAVTSNRHQKNKITHLTNINGGPVFGQADIESLTIDHFQDLYTSQGSSHWDIISMYPI